MAFPEKEFQVLAYLNREDKQSKFFYIYDIFSERLMRKVRKVDKPLKANQDDSDAFDIDLEGKLIVYVSGD